MTDLQPAEAIVKGEPYGVRLRAVGPTPVFPVGCRLLAQLRDYVGAFKLVAELSFDNGGLTRIDDDRIDIRLSADATRKLRSDAAVIDFVRTDVPERYLYILIQFPVLTPVTRRTA